MKYISHSFQVFSLFFFLTFQEYLLGTGKMAQQFRAFVALAEDQSSTLSTHMAAHNPRSRRETLSPAVQAHWACVWCTNIDAGETFIQIKHSNRYLGPAKRFLRLRL